MGLVNTPPCRNGRSPGGVAFENTDIEHTVRCALVPTGATGYGVQDRFRPLIRCFLNVRVGQTERVQCVAAGSIKKERETR